jgi:hypothetical protein
MTITRIITPPLKNNNNLSIKNVCVYKGHRIKKQIRDYHDRRDKLYDNYFSYCPSSPHRISEVCTYKPNANEAMDAVETLLLHKTSACRILKWPCGTQPMASDTRAARNPTTIACNCVKTIFPIIMF